jgi:hypothetical protein
MMHDGAAADGLPFLDLVALAHVDVVEVREEVPDTGPALDERAAGTVPGPSRGTREAPRVGGSVALEDDDDAPGLGADRGLVGSDAKVNARVEPSPV